ncbi:MAG TPA: hypothetical protein VNQ53_09230 [Nocardioides sp.]|nr:hypothetical protein [Nocardioides sp.]
MKKHAAKYAVTLAALAFAGLALGSGGLAAADPSGTPTAPDAAPYVPHPKTIVEVQGDKWNGFSIFRYDGSADFPPTNSEAKAECSEYDTRLDRVRCRTEVRVWYTDLGDLKRSINYQQALRRK